MKHQGKQYLSVAVMTDGTISAFAYAWNGKRLLTEPTAVVLNPRKEDH